MARSAAWREAWARAGVGPLLPCSIELALETFAHAWANRAYSATARS